MLKLEFKKINFLSLLLVTMIVPLLANAFGVINYLSNREVLINKWESLWTQVTLFYFLFFLIPLIAIVVASLWRVEHRAGLKFIRMSPLKNFYFIINKTILATIIIFFTQIYFLFLFFIFGKFICGFRNVDFGIYFYYIVLSVVFSLPVILFFNAAAIKIKSLGAVVIISILVSTIGMALSTQNIMPIFSKIAGLNYLGLLLNNQKFLNIDDFILMMIFGICESIIFFFFSNRSLRYE